MGILQYIAPSILVLLGVWLYGEPLPGRTRAGFVLIWTALARSIPRKAGGRGAGTQDVAPVPGLYRIFHQNRALAPVEC